MPDYDTFLNEQARGNARNIGLPHSRRLHADFKSKFLITTQLLSRVGATLVEFPIPAGLDARTFWLVIEDSGSGVQRYALEFASQETITYRVEYQWPGLGSSSEIAIRPVFQNRDFTPNIVSSTPDMLEIFYTGIGVSRSISPHKVLCSADTVRVKCVACSRLVGSVEIFLAVKSEQLANY